MSFLGIFYSIFADFATNSLKSIDNRTDQWCSIDLEKVENIKVEQKHDVVIIGSGIGETIILRRQPNAARQV